MDKNPKARVMSVLLIVISHRRTGELAAERDERPRRALRVPAEPDVTGERVLVPEEPLDGIPIVDAIGTGERVESIDRLGAELHRVGDVALEAELLLDDRGAGLPGDPLGLEAVRADDEPGRVDHRSRAGDAELHGLEIAHAHGGVV